MQRAFTTLLLLASLNSAAGLAQSFQRIESDGSILLPAQRASFSTLSQERQSQFSQSSAWRNFVQQHKPWLVVWNEAAGTPQRAFGKSVQIAGYSRLTRANVEAAVLSFISANQTLLGVNPHELQLVNASEVNNRWYVSFAQMKAGLEVLLSEVELRLWHDGKVMAFGADVHRDIEVPLQPAISFETAKRAAISGLRFSSPEDRIYGEPRLYILPVRQSTHSKYHLVYQVQVETLEPVSNYTVFVDAHNGEIVWRYSNVHYAEVQGKVKGRVQLVLATDPFVERTFANQLVLVGNTAAFTDSLGAFMRTLNEPATLTTELRGQFVNINRGDAADAAIRMTVNPGDTLNLLWNDGNSHAAERDAFYHVNFAHDFITALDPNFTRINYSMPVLVNRTGSVCQAFFDGTGITFDMSGGGCVTGAQIAGVVYHEYGHALNTKLYQQLGRPTMINGVAQEALADVFSVLMVDDPIFANGFFGPGTATRRLDQLRIYPRDLNPSSLHETGLILGGAFWDLRLNTSVAVAHRLAHFAKYGTPDDANFAVAFAEWFLEVLIADDDDGDLSNGTPHGAAIVAAFDKHGVGSALYTRQSFAHVPLSDTRDTGDRHTVSFTLQPSHLLFGEADSILLHYTANNYASVQTLMPSKISATQYQVEIPPQAAGTVVRYYFSMRDIGSGAKIYFPWGAPGDNEFSFLVGFVSKRFDDFERESGWAVSAPGDNATAGRWERADPQLTSVGVTPIQPGDDHSPLGSFCYVTGAAAGQNFFDNDVDNGRTTLLSPVYDLSNYAAPLLRYFKWYSNNGLPNPGQDFWVVDISNDAGRSWRTVERTLRHTEGWQKIQFKVSDFVTPTNAVQLRFVASDFNPPSQVEALLDDFEIFDVDSATVSVETPDAAPPARFALQQNYPNPFNPDTRIAFALPVASRVTLTVFDMNGRIVAKLVGNQTRAAGAHQISFSGKNLSSGIYFYRLEATPLHEKTTGFSETKAMLLVR